MQDESGFKIVRSEALGSYRAVVRILFVRLAGIETVVHSSENLGKRRQARPFNLDLDHNFVIRHSPCCALCRCSQPDLFGPLHQSQEIVLGQR